MTPDMPIEFLVRGTAISMQASARSRATWKETVRAAGAMVVPAGSWALTERVAVMIYYFPEGKMVGDIDNIIKPILDAMSCFIYVDDGQVERVVVQKFEPDQNFNFSAPTRILADALAAERPSVYIRVSDEPHEDLR